MQIDWWIVGCILIGAVIGLVLLPFKQDLSPGVSGKIFVLLFALFWPYFVLYGIPAAARWYVERWWFYLDSLKVQKARRL